MSVNEKFLAEDIKGAERVDVAGAPAALAPGEGETAALGVAIDGFQKAMETKAAKTLMVGTKVLLFNAALFLPLIAMGFLLFS